MNTELPFYPWMREHPALLAQRDEIARRIPRPKLRVFKKRRFVPQFVFKRTSTKSAIARFVMRPKREGEQLVTITRRCVDGCIQESHHETRKTGATW